MHTRSSLNNDFMEGNVYTSSKGSENFNSFLADNKTNTGLVNLISIKPHEAVFSNKGREGSMFVKDGSGNLEPIGDYVDRLSEQAFGKS